MGYSPGAGAERATATWRAGAPIPEHHWRSIFMTQTSKTAVPTLPALVA